MNRKDLEREIEQLKKGCCCAVITTTDGVPTEPPTNNVVLRFDPNTGILYYWDGDSWETVVTAVEDAAQIKTIEVELSSADILGMFTTPVVVIPGEVGKVQSILKVITSYTYGTVAYTNGGNVFLRDSISATNIWGTLANTSGTQMYGLNDFIVQNAGLNQTTPLAVRAGSDIQVSNLVGPYTNGDGTLKIVITYQTITV